ncbi:uncharacterized protein LOC132787079 [Drosophila nasuta]|uniref:uncharacterized protein LOC132787079 n=1 Tax=Drosophila nasuta TaxID=42062 RepID=UPI00295E9823|nr:uncharacterized protein LOC132787079 [Drosophila nasuta]
MKLVILFLTLIWQIRMVTQGIENCGCHLISNQNERTADCSNRFEINYDCLSHFKPTELTLKNNGLTEIPPQLFQYNFNNVQQLDLSYNAIKNLPDNSIHFLEDLKTFNVSCNSLKNPLELLPIRNDVEIFIANNVFKCNCEEPKLFELNERIKKQKKQKTTLYCLRDDLNETQKSIPLTAKCNNPEEPQKHWKQKAIQMGKVVIICFAILIFAQIIQDLWYACRETQKTKNDTQTEQLIV